MNKHEVPDCIEFCSSLLLCWTVILQVMECLKQNEELRGILDKLRMEQASGLPVPDSFKNGGHEIGSSTSTGEMASLKVSNIFIAYLLLFVISSCYEL